MLVNIIVLTQHIKNAKIYDLIDDGNNIMCLNTLKTLTYNSLM